MQKQKKINNKLFQVAPFMAVEALKLKAYLFKLFAPSLGELVGEVKSLDSEITSNNIAKAVEKLTLVLDENAFIALLKRLFQNVIVNWTDENGQSRAIAFNNDFDTAMDLVFKGELFSVYSVILFVLEVNYPDFFSKVSPLIGKKIQITSILGEGEKTQEQELKK